MGVRNGCAQWLCVREDQGMGGGGAYLLGAFGCGFRRRRIVCGAAWAGGHWVRLEKYGLVQKVSDVSQEVWFEPPGKEWLGKWFIPHFFWGRLNGAWHGARGAHGGLRSGDVFLWLRSGGVGLRTGGARRGAEKNGGPAHGGGFEFGGRGLRTGGARGGGLKKMEGRCRAGGWGLGAGGWGLGAGVLVCEWRRGV
jgi:hypothetical protein